MEDNYVCPDCDDGSCYDCFISGPIILDAEASKKFLEILKHPRKSLTAKPLPIQEIDGQ